MGQHHKVLTTVRFVVCILSFIGSVAFWSWGITTQENTPIVMGTIYTILTMWTFERWFTLRRDKL